MTVGDDRGVAPVIGFILIFSFLILAFTIYQGMVVPDQNREAEFEHSQVIQNRMQEVRNSIVAAATTGTGRSVTIPLGADYPQRTLARNLGYSGGMLTTANVSDAGGGIVIHNVTATDPEVADYLTAGPGAPFGPFPAEGGLKALIHQPVYSFYSGAPTTIYENSLVYNRFQAANLTLTNQLVVEDNRITILTLVGDVTESGRGSVTVDPDTLSGPVNRVPVRRTGTHVNVTLPTGNASLWEELLADDPNATVTRLTEDRIALHLNRSTYRLGMALVRVGSGTVDRPEAHYVTDVAGDEASVPENSTQRLRVEVRDRYNNPVPNANVTARIEGGVGTLERTHGTVANATTDAAGHASFVYNASLVTSTQEVDVNISIGDAHAREWVTFDLRVLETGAGAGATYQFISVVQAPSSTIASTSKHQIRLEVRNHTHDPLSGVAVTANAVNLSGPFNNGTFSGTNNRSTKLSDTRGRVVFSYTAPSTLDSVPIEITFTTGSGVPGRNRTSIHFNVTRTGSSGGGGGSQDINPSSVILEDVTKGTGNQNRIYLHLNNTANTTREIRKARIAFYSATTGSPPTYADLMGDTTDRLRFGDPYESVAPLVFNPNELRQENSNPIYLTFNTDPSKNDFFIFSVIYENGEAVNYFANVP